MKLLDATVFFRGLFLTSPSATNYAADSCPALKLHHFNVTQPSSSSGSWSDLCTADPRAPCNSSRALHWGHTVFSLRIWKSYYKPISKLPWSKYSQLNEDNPVQRAQEHSRGCRTCSPWLAKPNILHLTKECEGNLRNAELRWRQPVPKLLCFSSTSELCWTSLTEASWKIFSGLTEKHAKIWQDTSSFIMVTVGLPPFWSYVLPVALGTTNKPLEANLGRFLYRSSLALASTVPSKSGCNAPRFHCS